LSQFSSPSSPSTSLPSRSKRSAGFTLVELLVVLVILGLLAALVAPRVLSYLGSSKTKAAHLQITSFASALDLYRLDNQGIPTSAEGLRALIEKPTSATTWNGPYLAQGKVPKDPWGNDYHYAAPGQHGEYDLFSLGADNKEGGEDENQDVVNW
jgi:general secretion pathway protein G